MSCRRLQTPVRTRVSPSSRRAWIEISLNISANRVICVALLAEGVDRNACCDWLCKPLVESPSSRRAWIEILWQPSVWLLRCVALLAEGVDRNAVYREKLRGICESPSSRRAWIEIRVCRR